MDQYYNHYYEKFTDAIKLKCGYDFDYIIKYSIVRECLSCALSNFNTVIGYKLAFL